MFGARWLCVVLDCFDFILDDCRVKFFCVVYVFDIRYQCNKLYEPLKTERNLFYIRTQCVPRCKHSPLRL
jgi:hypothetical protein